MTCKVCKDEEEIKGDDLPYVIRRCNSCNREMRIYEKGEHGIGMKIRKGDQIVIPAGALTIHANPLKGRANLTEAGLKWFAKLIFLDQLPREKKDIIEVIDKNNALSREILKNSELLKDLDIENQEQVEQIFNVLTANQDSAKWFAFMFGFFNEMGKDAIDEQDAQKAAWAMTNAERFRSMLVFKQQLEEVVWMGHSAKKLVDILNVWDANRKNPDEEFWQIQFNESSYVLSQIFSAPVLFIQDKAYLGGMNIDGRDAKFVDYLYSGDRSNEAILIEIKNPMTPLTGPKYRSVYKPSAELSGAVIQISDYRVSLMQNFASLTKDREKQLTAFNPCCLIIAGNSENDLNLPEKKRSFELFRTGLQNVEIITFDELFKKIEILATLFRLRKKSV